MDYSTLNLDVLTALPVAKLPPTYRLQDGSGNGCYGDPPGYPSYFTRNVYTRFGNNPRRGPQNVITYKGVHYVVESSGRNESWDATLAKREALFTRLYKPLPIEHPRVQAWIASTLSHTQHCYRDVDRPEYNRPGTLIYPVPNYKLKTFVDDVRWNDDYRTAAKAEVDAFNKFELDRAAQIASVATHLGVLQIRKIYPDFTPELDGQFLPVTPSQRPGDWWETEAERPTPGTCPGNRPRYRGIHWAANAKHREDGWCQYCGYEDEPAGDTQDPRERGDDDGVEYGDPRDARDGRE